MKAIQAQNQQNFAKSQIFLEALVKKSPAKGLYWFNLGNTYFARNNFVSAISAYRKVIELKSPLAPAAYLYSAKSLRLSGRYVEALQALKAIQNTQLPAPLTRDLKEEVSECATLAADTGLRFYEAKKYEQARVIFKEVLESGVSGETAAQISLMQALTLYKLRRFDEAKAQLSKTAKIGSVRDAATQISKDLASISNQQGYPWWAFIDLSAGYNANLYSDNSADSPTDSIFEQLSLGGGYRYIRKPNFSAALAYSLYLSRYDSSFDSRFIQNSISAPFNYEGVNYWWSIAPFFNHEIVSTTAYMYKPGVQLSYGKSFKGQELGADYSFTKKIPANSNYDYLGGSIQELKGRWSFLSESQFLMPWIALGRETSQDLIYVDGNLPLANTYFGPGILWRKKFGTARVKTFEAGGSGSYIFKIFDNVSVPGSKKRSDRQFSAGLSGGYWFNKSVKSYADLTFIQNSSTLNSDNIVNKNYYNWVAVLGVLWDIHP